MKPSILLLICLVQNAMAQTVTLKRDTIFTNKIPYAIWEQGKNKRVGDCITSLTGKRLIEIHSSHINIKNRPGYVVTFSNDRKQAMIIKDAHFPVSFIKEIVKLKMVKDSSVDVQAEARFIKQHSLPDGYTDVEELIDF